MRCYLFRSIAACVGLFALVLTLAPASISAQDDQRCFAETGFCISGRIREYWQLNGGLAVFGFPIGPQQPEMIEGRPIQAQWFERNRLELHPENGAPYDVLLGRLGADRLSQQGRDWATLPRGAAQPECRFFVETGHSVCGAILGAWRARGLELDGVAGTNEGESLALFGLPLSEAQTETIAGQDYTVQWFERARFELHPENAPPFDVLFGLLGTELHPFVPRPLPVQPTSAPSVGTAVINVVNNTSSALTFHLSGPTNGTWEVAARTTLSLDVVPGSYRSNAAAGCGSRVDTFTVPAAASHTVTYYCVVSH